MEIVGKVVNEYDLRAVNDSRQSFYGKAYVEEYANGVKVLTSYHTKILAVAPNGQAMRLFTSEDVMSQTTCRHCKEFLMQYGDYDDLSGSSTKEKVMNLPVLNIQD